MPEIQDVRDFLSKMPTDRVHDDTIEQILEIANTIVESEKSSQAKAEQIEDAKLVYAAWQTMIAYASEMERSTGGVPAPIMTHQAVLEKLAEKLLEIVKRGAPTYVPANEQWKTLLHQYMDSELEEDYDFY